MTNTPNSENSGNIDGKDVSLAVGELSRRTGVTPLPSIITSASEFSHNRGKPVELAHFIRQISKI